MKYSDYMYLAGRLAFLTREADRTRALLTMPVFVTPGENDRDAPIVATVDPGQGEAVEIPVNRTGIWLAVVRVDNDIAGLMDGLVDGYVDANQDRADQGRGATAGFHALFQAMAGFMEATNMPVEGFGPFYPKIRERAGKWIELATTWFPDLNNNDRDDTDQVATHPSKRAVEVHPDRAMLSGFFNDDFKATRPGQQSRFDRFFYAMSTAGFTKIEWGRVAYAVKWNHKIVTSRVRNMDFTPWLKEFFQAIGVEPPKETRQNKYVESGYKRSRTKDFVQNWLG